MNLPHFSPFLVTAVGRCPFCFPLRFCFFRSVLFMFPISIFISQIGINTNQISININQIAINISRIDININRTSININAERIYITAKQICIIAVAININRLGSFMFLLVIFIFYVWLSPFLGEFYSFYLCKLWTCCSVN